MALKSSKRAHKRARAGRSQNRAHRAPPPGVLQAAAAAYGDGDLETAQRLFRKALKADPQHAGVLQYLGLIAQQRGDLKEAADFFSRAARQAPEDPVCQNNLGNVLREQGRLEEAIQAYRAAIQARPDYVNALFHLGTALRQQGVFDEAESCLRSALQTAPDDGDIWHELGLCHKEQKAWQEAAVCFRKAIGVRQDFPEAQYSLGAVLGEQGDQTGAEACYQEALRGDPHYYPALTKLAELHAKQGKFEAAVALFGRVADARPDDATAHHNLAVALTEQGKTGAAIRVWRRAVALDPANPEEHCGLGRALMLQGDLEEAIDAFNEALRLDPGFALAYQNLGTAYADRGNFTEAERCYREAVGLDPELVEALFGIATVRRFGQDDKAEMARMESVLAREELSDQSRTYLHFALGKTNDDCGNYREAFAHYRAGNRLRREGLQFSPEDHARWISSIMAAFNGEFFAARRGYGVKSELPVFITGMPRSGTTLIEQILASQGEVHGGGEMGHVVDLSLELPKMLGKDVPYPGCVNGIDAEMAAALGREYLARVQSAAPDASRITDKLPHNFLYLGLVALMLPGARIIHCLRDPMDVCLSVYFQKFDARHEYSYDLKELSGYYQQYRRLMAHWGDTLPLSMLEVRYEDVVANPEQMTRRLIDFCGLEWDDRCLQFHRSKRTVQTASNWQVRQPIYARSVQRWKNYEEFLGPLKEILEESA